jgi:hypothetical protein
MANYTAIKSEIQTDPVALGYGAWTTVTDDIRIQGILNDPSKRPLPRVAISGMLIMNACDPTEFAALTAIQLQRLATIVAPTQVDLANANIRAILTSIFPAAGPTRTALIALWAAQQQTQSRAQELGLGGTIEDVTYARTH